MMRTRSARAAALAALAVAGCGSSGDSAERSTRLVDFSKEPPYVNSLERDPGSGEFLLTTNRGFFRIDAPTKRVRRVRGTLAVQRPPIPHRQLPRAEGGGRPGAGGIGPP